MSSVITVQGEEGRRITTETNVGYAWNKGESGVGQLNCVD
jgi:hypothetical protein